MRDIVIRACCSQCHDILAERGRGKTYDGAHVPVLVFPIIPVITLCNSVRSRREIKMQGNFLFTFESNNSIRNRMHNRLHSSNNPNMPMKDTERRELPARRPEKDVIATCEYPHYG